jgi:hypothetical protein
MSHLKIKVRGHDVTVSEQRPDGSFGAWFGDYDLDCMEGWGMSELAAVQDLFDKECDANCDAVAQALVKAVMAEG